MNIDLNKQLEQLVAEHKIKTYQHRLMNSILNEIVMIDRHKLELMARPIGEIEATAEPAWLQTASFLSGSL